MDIVNADGSSKMISLWHKCNLALLGLAPVAFVLSPSALNKPIDLALALALPFHAHVGMNMVLTDYTKKILGKGALGPMRLVMVGITGTTTLGLLKLSVTGPGITETVKSLWRTKQ
mmetsp:Transcript_52722/g.93044  ORF Transcript_52722/g.93044 Transcript_52722/m.93044 type:complete len:116 (+) Transcript_52722:110-457(+)